MRRLLTATALVLLVLVCAAVTMACQGDEATTVPTEAVTEAPAPTVQTASEVDALILEIDGATIANEDKIDTAFLAYCSLSEEEKAKVVYYPVLANLRYELTKAYVVKDYMDTRMRHNELLIGAYVCSVQPVDLTADYHMQAMADCHVDYAWHVSGHGGTTNTAVLDRYEKYGIGVFEWAGNLGIYTWKGENRFQGEESANPPLPIEQFEATLPSREAADHNALWGFYMQDEPNAGDFDWMGAAGAMVQEKVLPDSAIMLNLYPNYAAAPQLGRGSYRAYIQSFVSNVKSDFICYDHYLYSTPMERLEGFSRTLENYDIVADICRMKDRDFYVILQNHSNDGEKMDSMTVETLRFQSYLSMAYGAKSLIWACWIEGWGTDNILNNGGDKSEQYRELQTVNAELEVIEPVYMRYTGKATAILWGEKSNATDTMVGFAKQNKAEKMEQTSLTDLSCGDSDYVVVGAFDKNVGDGEAYLFVGCNDIYFDSDVTATVTFKAASPDAKLTAYVRGIPTVLTPDESGVYTVTIVNADAVFVTVN